MKYYKIVENGYIVLVGENCGGEEITKAEYTDIMTAINNKPPPEQGYDYKLTQDLKWELFPLPSDE